MIPLLECGRARGAGKTDSPDPTEQKKQPSRILWVIPNYRAVSSDVKVPPPTPRGKLKLMVDDSFDYSSFLYVGFVTGLRMSAASYPEFGEGPAAYGQYYWRAFIDNVSCPASLTACFPARNVDSEPNLEDSTS